MGYHIPLVAKVLTENGAGTKAYTLCLHTLCEVSRGLLITSSSLIFLCKLLWGVTDK